MASNRVLTTATKFAAVGAVWALVAYGAADLKGEARVPGGLGVMIASGVLIGGIAGLAHALLQPLRAAGKISLRASLIGSLGLAGGLFMAPEALQNRSWQSVVFGLVLGSLAGFGIGTSLTTRTSREGDT